MKKITLLEPNLVDFYKKNITNPVGRVINITDDGRLIVK